MACAVRSGLLRSKGSAPQPRQKVGMPPSRFCSPSSQSRPACDRAVRVGPQETRAPGARRRCRPRRARRPGGPSRPSRRGQRWCRDGRRGAGCAAATRAGRAARRPKRPPRPGPPTESVVTQPARSESMGQLPSSRCARARKSSPAPATGCWRTARRDQAQHDEAGERHGLQVPAALRLQGAQDAQARLPRQRAGQPGQRVARGPVVMADLPDRDQRGQRIAHHRQAQRAQETRGDERQLEGKLGHLTPGLRPQPARRR